MRISVGANAQWWWPILWRVLAYVDDCLAEEEQGE